MASRSDKEDESGEDLKEQGKEDDYSADEYVLAVEQAQAAA